MHSNATVVRSASTGQPIQNRNIWQGSSAPESGRIGRLRASSAHIAGTTPSTYHTFIRILINSFTNIMLGMDNFNPSEPQARKPAPTVICWLCSRQFGSKSIAIHEPQCIKKWEAAQAKLPRNERRPLPPKPEIIKGSDGRVDVEATNEAAWQASQAAMIQCEHCGRRFGSDRLGVHQRSCTADNPAKPPPKRR